MRQNLYLDLLVILILLEVGVIHTFVLHSDLIYFLYNHSILCTEIEHMLY